MTTLRVDVEPLRCPSCHGPLGWTMAGARSCPVCFAAFISAVQEDVSDDPHVVNRAAQLFCEARES